MSEKIELTREDLNRRLRDYWPDYSKRMATEVENAIFGPKNPREIWVQNLNMSKPYAKAITFPIGMGIEPQQMTGWIKFREVLDGE